MGRGTSKAGGTQKSSGYANPTQDMSYFEGLPRYTGSISAQDMADYGKRFDLPTGNIQFVKNGEWVSLGRHISSYVMADGTHADLQFSRDRRNKFYLETIG